MNDDGATDGPARKKVQLSADTGTILRAMSHATVGRAESSILSSLSH